MSNYKLALLASGTGSNVKNIISYFTENDEIDVDCVIANKNEAGALNHALDHDIDCFVFYRSSFENGEVLELLQERGVTHVILAGFLLKIPLEMVKAYEGKMLNIHPSLLPNYGGAGMYGMNVHRAVVENQEKESGITIHLVNEVYDEGRVIEQFKVALEPTDTPEEVSKKVQQLEQIHFPKVIENYILNKES